MLWVKFFAALALAVAAFLVTNKYQDAPLWVSALVAVIPLAAPFLFEGEIKNVTTAMWRRLLALLKNDQYSFDLLVKFDIPAQHSIQDVLIGAETFLRRDGSNVSTTFQNGTTKIVRLLSPPVSVQIRVLPYSSDPDSDGEDEPMNTVEVSSVETQILRYRDRAEDSVGAVLARLFETSSWLSHSFGATATPQILVTVNKLKDAQIAQRPRPPINLHRDVAVDGTVVQRDAHALQVLARNLSGAMREIRRDLSSLEIAS